MSKAWAGGSTRAWRRVRAVVRARDGVRCTLRLEGCTGYADQVHHTLGRAVTGDDPRYCVPACGSCNLEIERQRVTSGDPLPRPRTRW